MSRFSCYRTNGNRKRTTSRRVSSCHLYRQLQFENLEQRTLLSATSLAYQPTTVVAAFSLEPIEPPPPIIREPGETRQSPTRDAGDFYWHFDDQIALLRMNDELVVKLRPEANRESVLDALANEGLTSRSESTISIDSRTLVVSRSPGSGALDAYSELRESKGSGLIDSLDGVG